MASLTVQPRQAAAVAYAPGPGLIVRMVGNETAKALITLWTRKATLIPQLLTMAITYLGMQYFIGGGRLVDELLPATMLAYVAYVFGYIALLKMSAGVAEEMHTGTLAQNHLSPLPAWVLSTGRVIATLVEGAAMAGLVSLGFILLLDIDIPLRPAAVIPLALTILDLAGFALLIGGLTLAIASIGAIVHVIQMLVMTLNGALIPVNVFPHWLELLAALVPSTLGIDATRQVLFDGASLTEAWSDGALPLAIVHAAAMLTLGWAVYQHNTRRALHEGRL